MLTKIRNLLNSMSEDKNNTEDTKKNIPGTPENIITNTGMPETASLKEKELTQTPVFKKELTDKEVKEEVTKILKTCYDPEIPVDVLELGLIYDIIIASNHDVMIIMTLTSPSCPVAGILPGEIEQKVREHPAVNDCKVQLTFDPPWNPNMMSEVAKLELGFL